MTSEAPNVPTETPGSTLPGVFGVGAGLLLIAACIAVVALFGWRTAPADEELGTRYALAELPFEFALHDDVFLLPGGERVFMLRPPSGEAPTEGDVTQEVRDAGAEGEPADEGEGSDATEGTGADDLDVDWAAVTPTSTGEPPSELYLVEYPLELGGAVIDSQFRSLQWRDLSLIESEGGSTPVEGGRIEWAGYAADFVRVRRFSSGPTFRDVLRVNLSVGRECWIAYAIWPPLSEGSTEPVRRLLDAIQLRVD